jgi:hypothetical protein
MPAEYPAFEAHCPADLFHYPESNPLESDPLWFPQNLSHRSLSFLDFPIFIWRIPDLHLRHVLRTINHTTIVCGDVNSDIAQSDPSCVRETDSSFCKESSEEYILELGNNGLSTHDGPIGSKSLIHLRWTTPLKSPLRKWEIGNNDEDTGSGHRLIATIC